MNDTGTETHPCGYLVIWRLSLRRCIDDGL